MALLLEVVRHEHSCKIPLFPSTVGSAHRVTFPSSPVASSTKLNERHSRFSRPLGVNLIDWTVTQ